MVLRPDLDVLSTQIFNLTQKAMGKEAIVVSTVTCEMAKPSLDRPLVAGPVPLYDTVLPACRCLFNGTIFLQSAHRVCDFLKDLNAITCCWLDIRQWEAGDVHPAKQSRRSEWV